MTEERPHTAHIEMQDQGPSGITVAYGGVWSLTHTPQAHHDILHALTALAENSPEDGAVPQTKVTFTVDELGEWGSTLITSMVAMIAACRQKGIEPDLSPLPEGIQRLVALAFAVPARADASRSAKNANFLERVGDQALILPHSVAHIVSFCKQTAHGMGRVFVGKSDMRWRDVLSQMQECGSAAFPIVSLISLLVGLILAFVGAVQLQTFGASIYVADLVSIGMVRVIGAIMAGITMAGRTGASFAAVLGTMQVNEEIDALHTLGVSPTEFLVLPRLIALVCMMPLLTIYSDLMGILGGVIVGIGMLDLHMSEYIFATKRSLSAANIWIGLAHGTLFGVVIAICGCYHGMRCGRSALAVGVATTAAVVSSIVSLILVTAFVTVICDWIGV